MNPPRHFALIPAAGHGTRLDSANPKQYLPIAGKPMLQHVLERFATSAAITHTFVVVQPNDQQIEQLLSALPQFQSRITCLRVGGDSRQQSVLNGLRALREQISDDDWILVHDAARPGLSEQAIDRLISAVADDAVGGLLALPIVDTIKRANTEVRAQTTLPREQLWAAQTPQMFRYALLCRALGQAGEFTDESSAVEALGLQPKLVAGNARNFKVTLPADLQLAALYLKSDEQDE